MKASLLVVLLPLLAVPCVFGRKKEKPPSPADQQLAALLKEAEKNQPTPSAGSIFVPQSRLSDLARDVRAGQLHDLVNIVVNDQASAVSSGVTNTSRKSSANASITALAGQLRATGPWANLANLSGSQQIQGQGTTSRDSTLTTSLSAEVRYVFPNGNLLIQGRKELYVNGEHQTVTLSGVIRLDDISATNSITSDRIANLDIFVNGKGIVADSVKKPFILYRILMDLLPF